MAVWADGWVDAPGATAMTAGPRWRTGTLPRRWRVSRAADRFVDGVEWFLADRELKGRAADLARFGLLWVDGALVVAGPARIASRWPGPPPTRKVRAGIWCPSAGIGMLVERLAEGFRRTAPTPVSRIEHGGPSVVVFHAGEETFEADRVVVTVPLGVLRNGSHSFRSAAHGDHAQAVERLEMATLEKVGAALPERFWPTRSTPMHPRGRRPRLSRCGSTSAGTRADSHPGGASTTPPSHPSLAGSSRPRQRVGPALEVLRKMFGSVAEPEETRGSRTGPRGSLGAWLLQLRAARGERRRHAPPGAARVRPAAAGRRGHGS